MPGKWITKQQVELYMETRGENRTQKTSAAKAGISERSGRNIEKGQRQEPHGRERHWRTREDPLAEVWDIELKPLLQATPDLQAMTLLEHLQRLYPEQYPDSVLRTLQRRVKAFKALHGPEKEVMFRQVHEPGRMGLSDFTKLKGVIITIQGERFTHLLYHFRLIYSKWSYVQVIVGGESYTALAKGLQDALLCLGGAPSEHRTDSLSAAYKNLSQAEAQDITSSYQSLCSHYGMQGSRNNRGKGHENGGVESPHGHIKRRIKQALLLRKSNDFESIESYQCFLEEVVGQHNARNAKKLEEERGSLQTLPKVRTVDYTLIQAVVSSSSTILVRRITYSVPSRLIGHTLQVRLYDQRVVCYLGSAEVLNTARVYPTKKNGGGKSINYRHLIESLVKKPQAFRGSVLRDDLLPNADYRTIWDHVDATMDAKVACRFMVGLLQIAAKKGCEHALAKYVLGCIEQERTLRLIDLQDRFAPPDQEVPSLTIDQHALPSYDSLLTGAHYVN